MVRRDDKMILRQHPLPQAVRDHDAAIAGVSYGVSPSGARGNRVIRSLRRTCRSGVIHSRPPWRNPRKRVHCGTAQVIAVSLPLDPHTSGGGRAQPLSFEVRPCAFPPFCRPVDGPPVGIDRPALGCGICAGREGSQARVLAAELVPIQLPKPEISGGMPLMQALARVRRRVPSWTSHCRCKRSPTCCGPPSA